MVVICFSDFSCSKVCDVAYDFQHATHIGDHCIFFYFLHVWWKICFEALEQNGQQRSFTVAGIVVILHCVPKCMKEGIIELVTLY